MKTQIHIPIEIELPKDLTLEFVTVSSKDRSFNIPVFQKANGGSFIRFASPVEGTFSFETNGKKQSIDVSEYTGTNPLFVHGPIRVSSEGTLEHRDKTPFFYLSDTLWFGNTDRMSDRDFDSLLSLRKSQGFSAIQIVVGVPPEVDAFDKSAKNSGGFPFTKDWSLNKAYFDHVDRRIQKIVDAGLVPVLFGGWGHHIDWMGVEPVKNLWREIIARFSAYPVMFSLAGEVDVFLVPQGIDAKQAEAFKSQSIRFLERFPRPVFEFARNTKRFISRLLYKRYEKSLLKHRLHKWSEIGQYVSRLDPYARILTAHAARQISVFDLFGNPSWLTLNSIQSGHSVSSLPFMIRAIRNGRKPIINLEPWYEGITGNFDSYYQRVAFWACILSGASGHGYGAHGIWQYSHNDNFMKHWGESDASAAKHFAGAIQLGLARNYLNTHQFGKVVSEHVNIHPTHSENNPFFPLGGRADQATLIYIPDQKAFLELKLSKPLRQKHITVIDPQTMKKIKTMHIAGDSIVMPVDDNSSDILLVLE